MSFGNPSASSYDPRGSKQFKGGRRNNHHQRPAKPNSVITGEHSQQESFGAVAMPTVISDDEFEVGSVFNPGSKKQNLNHLLNFQFEPRDAKTKRFNMHHRSNGGGNKPKYNKEQYLQANCQFVVKSSGDYSIHLNDPDKLVDWDLIEQVVLKTTAEVPSCPICLYPPKAAKVARCGHVFCWPCILHYLALSDHTWRKCPICYEAIHRSDLKSVVSIAWKEFQLQDEIEFCLMRRERNSLFALPVDQYLPQFNEQHPNVNDELTSYSNLVLASPQQVGQRIIAMERKELERQYEEEKDEPEACFIEEALQYLTQRQSSIDLNDDGRGAPKAVARKQEEAEKSPTQGSPKETFYFYQSSDGQPIFLHPLNIQMLIHEFGSLENCPPKIKGKIVERESTSMDENLRNRLRYLKHLPLTSIFEVYEIQLCKTVSKETLHEFHDQLEIRKKKRLRRARDERRREKWIQVEENKKMGMYPEMKSRIESSFHFPHVNGASNARSNESLASIESSLSCTPPNQISSLDEPSGTFSFAKMLKEGVAKPSSLVHPITSPPLPKHVEDSEPEPEDYVPPPPKASLGDALAHAFAQASITTSSGNSEQQQQPTSKKNKKKMKGQKISLTGSARPIMD